MTEETAEMPSPNGRVPTIEEHFSDLAKARLSYRHLTSIAARSNLTSGGQDSDATAEINLDDLDLDIDGVSDTEVAAFDDLDATGRNETLSDTGINEALAELDLSDVTGKNPELDVGCDRHS